MVIRMSRRPGIDSCGLATRVTSGIGVAGARGVRVVLGVGDGVLVDCGGSVVLGLSAVVSGCVSGIGGAWTTGRGVGARGSGAGAAITGTGGGVVGGRAGSVTRNTVVAEATMAAAWCWRLNIQVMAPSAAMAAVVPHR